MRRVVSMVEKNKHESHIPTSNGSPSLSIHFTPNHEKYLGNPKIGVPKLMNTSDELKELKQLESKVMK